MDAGTAITSLVDSTGDRFVTKCSCEAPHPPPTQPNPRQTNKQVTPEGTEAAADSPKNDPPKPSDGQQPLLQNCNLNTWS